MNDLMVEEKTIQTEVESPVKSYSYKNHPTYDKPFKPAWWLHNRHLQCIWPTYFRKNKKLKTRHERFELIDGDFIDAEWVGPQSGPIVVVLHGLEGSIESPYANAILHAIEKTGWRALFIHFRNCSTSRNRLDRFYHIGDTGDIMNVLSIIRNREPSVPLAVLVFSWWQRFLNGLVKWDKTARL